MLLFVEASSGVERPRATPLPGASPGDTRLVIYWIDSLSDEDLADPRRLVRLKRRLPRALHGRVRACTDAISVPCFTAMSTGVDRFSLFSLARNFGGADGVPAGSVFHDFQARGLKLGFIGDPQIAAAVTGFDWVEILPVPDDAYSVDRALTAMEEQGLSVVVVHLRVPDEVSHVQGPSAPEYDAALDLIDREIEAAWARLRATDHVVVLGDHGHTADGRHFAGLDVPTYAAFFGPVFRRPLERPMAITDHAALWARVFGLRFGNVPWVEAYFAGEPLAPQADLPPLDVGDTALSLPAAAVAVLLALLVAAPHRLDWLREPAPRRLALAAAVFGAAGLLLGLGYTTYRPALYLGGPAFNASVGLACAVLGLCLSGSALAGVRFADGGAPRRVPAALFMAGAVCLALPTVYKFGGVFTAVTAFVAALAAALIGAVRGGRRVQAAAIVALGLVVMTLWDPAVRNFAVRWFPFYTEKLGAALVPATVGLAAAALALPALARREGRASWLAAAAAGVALAVAGRSLPPDVLIAPCAAGLPLLLLAHRRPRLAPIALVVAPPALAFFFRYDATVLGPVAATLLAWPLWAAARRDAPVLERAVGLVVLLWLCLWTMVGCRITGIDFAYFFQWLPPGANVEDSWGTNALMTLAKYVSVPVLGLLLARRTAPEAVDAALPVAWYFGRVKLAVVLLFVVGFSMRPTGAGPFITADVLQEAALWIAILLFLLPMPITRAARTDLLRASLGAARRAPAVAPPEPEKAAA